MDLGENYHLYDSESEKLKQQGMFIRWDARDKIEKVEVASYKQILSHFSRYKYKFPEK